MTCVVGFVAGVIVVLAAGSAQAKTAPAPQAPQVPVAETVPQVPVTAAAPQVPVAAPAPQVPVAKSEAPLPGTKWYLGVLSGLQEVARTGPVVGGEFGIRLRKNVQVVVEAGWLRDVVTDSRVAEVASFGTYLQQTQGLPATAEIDAPAWFGTVGLRYIYENSSEVRPYFLANAGIARVEFRPTFTLNNLRISSNVSQYGITLGRDLLGAGSHLAYGAGAGLVFGQKWYLDLGVRLTRITTPDHATNVGRLNISVGRRF